MNERETAGRLNELRAEIYDNHGWLGADNLENAIRAALLIEQPPGKPDELDAASKSVGKAAINVDNAQHAVKKLRTKVLPAAWSGEASVSASAALSALERIFERAGDAFAEAKRIFAGHGQDLSDAHTTDKRGVGPLQAARNRIDGHTGLFDFLPDDDAAVAAAHGLAMTGVDDRCRAANSARDAAERAASTLKDLASAARLQHLAGSSMDPLSELLISDAGGGGDADDLILTPVMADRARAAVDRLGPADRQRLDHLLSQAKSPEEAAYIMKALAAGYPMDEVVRFDNLIHAHGDDPAWLQNRLSPMDTTDSANDPPGVGTLAASHGQPWSQGNTDPTCATAASVLARAQVDPVYALQLTTGGHPDDVAYDHPGPFAQRLRDEQQRLYDEIRAGGGGPDAGFNAEQVGKVANEHLAPSTGVQYENQHLDSADARREALRKAEEAVDRGIPVPFNTKTHEMVIVGHDGDRIQVFNPSRGYTVWITEQEFIDGNLHGMGGGKPPVHIRVPK